MRALTLLLLLAATAAAHGIVLDPPESHAPRRAGPVRLVEHHVEVEIVDGLATTRVRQAFQNPNSHLVEGVYLFPLPDGAAVSRFTMEMGGRQVKGEILDATRAREIYRSIVHRRRDPGLLEYAGRRCIRARIFPIPPRGRTQVTLSYSEVLEPTGGLYEYTYPLRSNGFSPGPLATSGVVRVRGSAGVKTLFSPSHALDVARGDDGGMSGSFEESRSAGDRDLRLLYGTGRAEFGIALASHKPAGDDGTFVLLLSPDRAGEKANAVAKDIVFVIDTSGSMGDRGGRKMAQAKAAVGYALGRLGPRDRFNVIGFATEPRPFRKGVVAATKENVAAALAYVDALEATGGTAIHAALLRALELPAETERVPYLLFLTDGEPTIGPTDAATILRDVKTANRAGARLFAFGVGDGVNATLLTELVEGAGGSGHFVTENENIELKVSSLYDRIASPVLTDVTVDLGDSGEYDVYPRRCGDLFRGQQLAVVGRYKKSGARAIRLRGKLAGREVTYVYEATFADSAGADYLPRLWAVRKVGYLLTEIRRNGERAELVNEVRELGIRYGIVTPYTSFLVVEERELRRAGLGGGGGGGPEALDRAEAEADDAREALKEKKAVGKGAVSGARLAERLRSPAPDRGVAGVGVRRVAGKTFRYRDGVWVDVDVADGRAADERVRYLSEEYDALLADDALARLLAVGPRVKLLFRDKVYEIIE